MTTADKPQRERPVLRAPALRALGLVGLGAVLAAGLAAAALWFGGEHLLYRALGGEGSRAPARRRWSRR